MSNLLNRFLNWLLGEKRTVTVVRGDAKATVTSRKTEEELRQIAEETLDRGIAAIAKAKSKAVWDEWGRK